MTVLIYDADGVITLLRLGYNVYSFYLQKFNFRKNAANSIKKMDFILSDKLLNYLYAINQVCCFVISLGYVFNRFVTN